MRGHSGDLLFGRSDVGCARQSAIRLSEISGNGCSSVERDQVLEDQVTPAFPARMHKQSAFRKPAELDGRETELFRKRTNLRCSVVIVARQEHDPRATVYGWVLVKDGSDQMVEAF